MKYPSILNQIPIIPNLTKQLSLEDAIQTFQTYLQPIHTTIKVENKVEVTAGRFGTIQKGVLEATYNLDTNEINRLCAETLTAHEIKTATIHLSHEACHALQQLYYNPTPPLTTLSSLLSYEREAQALSRILANKLFPNIKFNPKRFFKFYPKNIITNKQSLSHIASQNIINDIPITLPPIPKNTNQLSLF